jgi:(1->4)-alpha-D-glucan 1-alpha-D-glucosylmutase
MKKQIPTSSYRLNLSKSFNFEKAKKILPFLKKLGVEMVYTGPIFEKVSKQDNYYMIVTPWKIAKDLGGEGEFLSFCKECKNLSLKIMMDIVPNHMAVSMENIWWKDVVENKEKSKFADFFDIDWKWGGGKVILPTSKNIHQTINYRRFFDICEMVGLNIEKEQVYDFYFSKIKEYVRDGLIDGFRIDHIDGLKFPKRFLEKISHDFPDLYVAVEKILVGEEVLPKNWICDGTVGYDILFLIDQVLLNKDGKDIFSKIYEKYKEEEVDLIGIKISYLNHYLISEVNRFANLFGEERENLLQFLAHFPVYRTYFDENTNDLKPLKYAASFTKGDFFKKKILKKEHREALLKLQQIMPAVFAKGVEDTYNYRDFRLSSLNEVGGDLRVFSISNQKFHKMMGKIYKRSPNTMHTLSTHDTKRSLDARMKLHTLAEIGEEFKENVDKWMQIVNPFLSTRIMYFFFQSLIAISQEDVSNRIKSYMIKAVREGKYYSDHLNPNLEFEKRLENWIKSTLDNKEFMDHFILFKNKVEGAAKLKSICAIVLQIGLFGVMDLYQGEELFNANLVDPDNRRQVDFELRKISLENHSCLKMEVINKGLNFRTKYRDLILKGSYEPLKTKSNQVGYIRRYGKSKITVIVNKFHLGGKAKSKIKDIAGEPLFAKNMPFQIYTHLM